MHEEVQVSSEEATLALAARWTGLWRAGDVVFLQGDLGAGKTTFVRGVLKALEWHGEVRSPTFTLLQSYATNPPILHADLYRLSNAEGLGLEDYLDTHLAFIEWPDRAASLISTELAWHIEIYRDDAEVSDSSRRFVLIPPVCHGV